MFEVIFTILGLYALYRLLDKLVRIPRISDLSSRYVFITGCDTGFGNKTCKKLDKLGCHVFAGCLTEQGEAELKKSCSNRVVPIKLDVTKHESIVKAFKQVKELLPAGNGIWALLNNAGIAGKVGPSEWFGREDYQGVLNVNLLGLIDMTTTFLPLLKKARGRVINTASVFGRFSMGGSAPYCISKYGVESYSDSLRREIQDFGVTVHIIEPGFHKTNITDVENLKRNILSTYENVSPELKEEYGQAFVDKSIEIVLKSFMSGVVAEDITPVVDGYVHAVTAKYPRGRYLIGTDAKYLWVPLTMVPEWASDWFIRKTAPDRPVPAALLKEKTK